MTLAREHDLYYGHGGHISYDGGSHQFFEKRNPISRAALQRLGHSPIQIGTSHLQIGDVTTNTISTSNNIERLCDDYPGLGSSVSYLESTLRGEIHADHFLTQHSRRGNVICTGLSSHSGNGAVCYLIACAGGLNGDEVLIYQSSTYQQGETSSALEIEAQGLDFPESARITWIVNRGPICQITSSTDVWTNLTIFAVLFPASFCMFKVVPRQALVSEARSDVCVFPSTSSITINVVFDFNDSILGLCDIVMLSLAPAAQKGLSAINSRGQWCSFSMPQRQNSSAPIFHKGNLNEQETKVIDCSSLDRSYGVRWVDEISIAVFSSTRLVHYNTSTSSITQGTVAFTSTDDETIIDACTEAAVSGSLFVLTSYRLIWFEKSDEHNNSLLLEKIAWKTDFEPTDTSLRILSSQADIGLCLLVFSRDSQIGFQIRIDSLRGSRSHLRSISDFTPIILSSENTPREPPKSVTSEGPIGIATLPSTPRSLQEFSSSQSLHVGAKNHQRLLIIQINSSLKISYNCYHSIESQKSQPPDIQGIATQRSVSLDEEAVVSEDGEQFVVSNDSKPPLPVTWHRFPCLQHSSHLLPGVFQFTPLYDQCTSKSEQANSKFDSALQEVCLATDRMATESVNKTNILNTLIAPSITLDDVEANSKSLEKLLNNMESRLGVKCCVQNISSPMCVHPASSAPDIAERYQTLMENWLGHLNAQYTGATRLQMEQSCRQMAMRLTFSSLLLRPPLDLQSSDLKMSETKSAHLGSTFNEDSDGTGTSSVLGYAVVAHLQQFTHLRADSPATTSLAASILGEWRSSIESSEVDKDKNQFISDVQREKQRKRLERDLRRANKKMKLDPRAVASQPQPVTADTGSQLIFAASSMAQDPQSQPGSPMQSATQASQPKTGGRRTLSSQNGALSLRSKGKRKAGF